VGPPPEHRLPSGGGFFASWDLVEWDALVHELRQVTSLAREIGLWVVAGSCHRLTSPHRLYSSLYVISAQGELVTRLDN
jgi:predicted amidohydrolase